MCCPVSNTQSSAWLEANHGKEYLWPLLPCRPQFPYMESGTTGSSFLGKSHGTFTLYELASHLKVK